MLDSRYYRLRRCIAFTHRPRATLSSDHHRLRQTPVVRSVTRFASDARVSIQMELKQRPCDQKLSAQNQEASARIFCTIDNQDDHGRRVRACFHGWVILTNHPDNILWSLWNPLTSDLIRLPPLKREKNTYECCLSSPPDDPCSVFLLLSDTIPTIVFCRLDRKRKRLKWTEMSYAKQLRTISGVDDCFLRSPTCCNGKVYAMALGEDELGTYRYVTQVGIVSQGKEEVVINLLPFAEGPDINPLRCPSYDSFGKIHIFLKGISCTDLIFIGLCSKGETGGVGDVYLFSLDITGKMWEQIVGFEDAIFYVQLASDYSACYYGSAKVGGYVHILSERDNIIYSFYAKDRTIAISSIKSQASSWAMLDWRLEYESKQEEVDKDTKIVARPVDGDSESESHLLNIPIDILQMIMELCVGREYVWLCATCKHCYLAAPTIQWSSKATLRRLQAHSLVSPLLMVLDNDRGIITFIDPTRDDRYFVQVPQELKGGDYQICCSRYGWVLMYEFLRPLVFFNPFTRNTCELPELQPYLDSICFSAPPTSPDCMVVGFETCELFGYCIVYFCLVSRDSTWRTFRLGFGDNDPFSYRFPIFKGRDVYALCNNKGTDIFKFKDMTEDIGLYSWEALQEKSAPISGCISPRMQYFLSKCDQHLLLVVVGEFGESVEVFEATEEEWEKIDNLGKRVIYISDTSCICFEAKSPEMENKIYFPRLLDNQGTKIVFYSLQTCRFHTFDDKQGFGADLLTTKHHCYPHTWIQSSWS